MPCPLQMRYTVASDISISQIRLQVPNAPNRVPVLGPPQGEDLPDEVVGKILFVWMLVEACGSRICDGRVRLLRRARGTGLARDRRSI